VSNSLANLSLRHWSTDPEASIDFLLRLGALPDLADLTHFESFLNPKIIHQWLLNKNYYVRIISVDSQFVGLLAAHPPISSGIPDGFLETSTYIVGEWRNRGVGVEAWSLAERELGNVCLGLAGVTWLENTASIRRLKRSGYQSLKVVWYESQTEGGRSGWCEVWVKRLER